MMNVNMHDDDDDEDDDEGVHMHVEDSPTASKPGLGASSSTGPSYDKNSIEALKQEQKRKQQKLELLKNGAPF